ncbi:hypothetical protein ACKWTF_005484 [Chironomus riparius]
MIHFGRSDFDNIDNEALDFEQLEAFIQNNAVVHSPSQTAQTVIENSQINPANLPESPPDSGSEPPYSPNIKGGTQNIQIDHNALSMNTLTELHVPHHNHLHHNLLTPSSELYLANDQQQQLIQINNILHKNDGSILHHSTTQDHQMVLYQVNQHGQIMELNHHHLPSLNNNTTNSNNRLYKSDMLDITDATTPLSTMHDIQQTLHSSTINDNLPIIIGGNNNGDNSYPRSMVAAHEQQQQLSNHNMTNGIGNVKKRKSLAQNSYSEGNLKPFVKSEAKLPKSYHGSKSKKKQQHHQISQDTCTSEVQNEIIVDTKKHLQPHNDTKSSFEHFQENSSNTNNENKNSSNFTDNVIAKGNESGSDGSQIQCIRFSPFQQHQWHTLLDHNHQELAMPHFRVDADKGFNFSNSDDAFVCQKKNHFQITCHVQLHGNGVYVKTQNNIEKVRTFHLHFYGVKLETPAQTIRIEQSQSDRSKKPFYPVLVDLQNSQVGKITVGRLHFSETTCNNMRKKGRPNPEQRYFQLVVGLHAHTYTGYFPIISHASERIIVRASNPGQFEGDVDLCCWQRGVTQNSIFHQGKIGINTDMPDESLVVSGNLKVSGHIIQPSDVRIKYNISELETKRQLENINQIRIVKYQYDEAFAENNELDSKAYQTGIIAQELQKILPDAIYDSGNLRLADGTNIDNFLQVNKNIHGKYWCRKGVV